MNTDQFYFKEIIINQSIEHAFNNLLAISKLKEFEIESQNTSLGTITYTFQKIGKLEIRVEKISEDQTRLKVFVLTKDNSYYKPCELASNKAKNFEKALTLVIENRPEEYKPETDKIGAGGCISIVITIIIIGFCVYFLMK